MEVKDQRIPQSFSVLYNFFFPETGFHVDQATLELSIQPRTAVNS